MRDQEKKTKQRQHKLSRHVSLRHLQDWVCMRDGTFCVCQPMLKMSCPAPLGFPAGLQNTFRVANAFKQNANRHKSTHTKAAAKQLFTVKNPPNRT